MFNFLGPFTLMFYFAIGILVGIKWFPAKWQKANQIVQTVCLCAIMFSMGASMGLNPNLWQELQVAGVQSLCYALLTIAFSVLVVYLITRIFFRKKEGEK